MKRRKILPFWLLALPLLFATCKKGDDVTYHKTRGEGYVFFRDSAGLRPIANHAVRIKAFDGGDGWFPWGSGPSVTETVETDANGKYRLRFVKKHNKTKIVRYVVYVSEPSPPPPPPHIWWYAENPTFDVSLEQVTNASDTLKLDTTYFFIP